MKTRLFLYCYQKKRRVTKDEYNKNEKRVQRRFFQSLEHISMVDLALQLQICNLQLMASNNEIYFQIGSNVYSQKGKIHQRQIFIK